MQLLRPLLMVAMLGITFFTVQRKRWFKQHPKTVEDLTAITEPELSAEVLMANLSHPEWKTRLHAVQQLAGQLDETRVPDFIKLLHDTDYDVREAARDTLERIGESAVPGLIDTLKNGNMDARQLAAQALSVIGSEAAMPQLITALKDESMWVRTPAAVALGKINHPDAVSALKDALRDESAEVRQAVIAALRAN